MSLTLTELPPHAGVACERLLHGARAILGDDLVALWSYGAATFPDPPRLGDVDAHGIVARAPDAERGEALEALHREIETVAHVELDCWYVLLEDARRAEPPPHAFKPGLSDRAWGLHRAHWLAGRVVVLHGPEPRALVLAPAWKEIAASLAFEISYVKGHLCEQWAWGYCTLQMCRLNYSFETRDVVISKRASGEWAIERFPAEWHPLIRAAQRRYDDEASEDDIELLRTRQNDFVAWAMQRLDTVRS